MGSLFKAAIPLAFVVVMVAFSVLAQSGPGRSNQDVVEKLLPNETVPKDLAIKPELPDSIVKKLKQTTLVYKGFRDSSYACATRSSVVSSKCRANNCNPIGSFS